MKSTFTKYYRILLAKMVRNLTDVSANSYLPSDRRSWIYVVLGKQLPWNSGTETIPDVGVSYPELNELYKHGIYAKLVTFDNSAMVVPRIDWTSNTVYNTYLSETNHYVLNSKDQVFKCLSNVSSGTVSTDEPELTLSTTSLEEPYLQTADGYKWKYLYTISSSQKQKFMDKDWMPVTSNKFVQAAAVPGSIDIVTVTNSGNNYVDGTLQDIISVTGDGSGSILKANVSGGKIRDVIVQDRGENYTEATLSFRDVSGGVGSSASAAVSISPHDGHGYDAEFELGTSSIMFNVEFDGTESGTFPADNDYRQVFAVSNPFENGTETFATKTKYTLFTKITTSPGLGDFNNDEKVFQGNTFDESTYSADVISFDRIQNVLYVNNVKGTLQENQALKGFSSGSIRVATSSTSPDLHLYTGKVLYISNRLPVTRDPDQLDRIKFIISF